ncbi:hypothetical protein AT15_03860 [Kosmotoga arenicorallina S304]|uniref:Glycoside hydrolase family 38 central domain-containing protein n=1 Tax=Kosmotoga arenicorallina S304 TaxID=1453497 RepID=A0A176JYW0_9BACT|nr:alpha-mannosidase [Kosmotoga arenicorallina]OAA29134.1 hypothetical protein AT15_03860 [Kosmotoga arenicorallina S304]
MYPSVKELYARFNRILGEIIPYRIKRRIELGSWSYTCSASDVPPEKSEMEIKAGFKWDPGFFPVWFTKELELPAIEKGEMLLFKTWAGGESLVLVDGKASGEINEYHKDVDLSEFADGKKHRISIQTVPKGLFGTSVFEPMFESSFLLVIDREIDSATRLFHMSIEVLKNTDNKLLTEKLAQLLDEAFSKIQIPRDSEAYFKATRDNPYLYPEVSKIWNPEKFPLSNEYNLSTEQRNSIIQGANLLKEKLRELKELIPSPGKLVISGHAHIDYAWLWPIEETKRKIRRTFANSLRLAKKYHDFVYVQSSAQMYKDIKESDPALYKEIKELVKKGNWVPIGGSWVENDCNVPGAESLIRQLLMGQRFFMKEFGIKSKVGWLPDVFGFSWILPQILKSAGIEYFFSIKLSWNEKNKMPSDLFRWRGIDGTEVIYHSFDNPNGNYNAHIEPFDIIETWNNYKDKRHYPVSLLTFGYGDGGGGPTDEMIENYEILKDFPGMPKLEMKSPEEFFKNIPEQEKLPIWDGELYFELHRGTLTSQSRTKSLHKKAEDLLYDAELLCSLAYGDKDYPRDKLNRIWETLLHNEFHDILPGSSIGEVYKDAEKELENVCSELEQIKERAFENLIEPSEDIVVAMNTGSYSKPLLFSKDLGGKALKRSNGEILEPQRTYDGSWLYFSKNPIEPFSVENLEILDSPVNGESNQISEGTTATLENELLRVLVDEDGTLSIFDKEAGREVFTEKGNQLWLYNDVPAYWDAWDIDYHHKKYAKRIKANFVEKVESGKLRSAVKISYDLGESQITQIISLLKGSRRVDVDTQVNWHHRRSLLKVLFPVNILSRYARYDLSAGYVERATHNNTDFEKARFEVPAHRWMDLSERGYGVSILNNGKYGHACRGNVMELTPLRSPVFPHFFADEGAHSFSYAIYPHIEADLMPVQQEAEALNRPIITALGKTPVTKPFLKIEPKNVKLLAFKGGEEGGMVIRVAETLGERGKMQLELPDNFREAWLCNILEEPIEKIQPTNSTIELEYKPFKILTLLLK